MLWKSSFVLRALCPLSLDHDFLHLRMLTHPEDADDCQFNHSTAAHHLLLQWLCVSLTRAAAPVKTSTLPAAFCAAFPNCLTAISVVFPAGRRTEMKDALQHFLATFSEIRLDCTPEEDFGSGFAMEDALLSGLGAALVFDGWTVFEGNVALHGGVKEWLDGTLMEAVAFGVRTEANDCIDFVLSPDVIRFRPFKIERLLIGPLKNRFDDGAVVAFDDYLEDFSPDDILEMKCLVLPSLQEGFVTGCCRVLPKEFNLNKHKEIWNKKHGLVLPNELFYISVSFPLEEIMKVAWFPSCLVLRSCGIIPALPSIRAARSRSIISKITSSISRWDFFSFGKLKLKPICQAVEDPQSSWWTTASSMLQTSQIELNDSNFEHDLSGSSLETEALLSCFRRPKLPSCYYAVSEKSEPSVSDLHGINSLSVPVHLKNPARPSSSSSFRIPVFLKRKIRDEVVGCRSEVKQKLSLENKTSRCMDQGESSKYQQGDSASSAAESLGVISLPKKRVCAEKSLCNRPQASASKLNVDEVPERILLGKRAPGCPQPSTQKLQKPLRASKVTPHAKSNPPDIPIHDQNAKKAPTSRQKKSAGGEKKSSTPTTIDSDANKNKVKSKHAEGKLSDLTIPELKLFLSESKSKVSGKKEELMRRVVLILSALNKA